MFQGASGFAAQTGFAADEKPNPLIGPALEHPSPALQAAGPAVWHEEFWDVKPRRLAADAWDAKDLKSFADLYEKNSYGIMLRIPGFRGTTIVTSIAPSAEVARATKFAGWKGPPLGGADEFYVPQRGVMMDGTIRTDTSINWGSILELLDPDRTARIERETVTKVKNHWDMFYRFVESSLTFDMPGKGK